MSDAAESWVRFPDPERPVVSMTEAARLLNRDIATVRNYVCTDKLAGGKYPDKVRWWVYVDADPRLQAGLERKPKPRQTSRATTLSPDGGVHEPDRQLAATASGAKLREYEETIRQLTAAAALEAERAEAANKVNESLLRAHEHLLKAFTDSRSEAGKSLQIANIYRDLLASNYIPDDPGELTQN